jgi:deoxycytidylate deaminase
LPKTLTKRARPSWDEYFMQVANVVKSRSTCLSSAKGAVLVSGRQIVSTGYNGTPAGTKHCDEGGCARCLAVKEGKMKSGTNLDACACLPGETVLMGDNKPISEYKIGDNVAGMHRLNSVAETFRREYDGDMITVKAKGILPFSLTPDHPLLVINADNRPNWDLPNLRMEWRLAGELRERRNRPKYSKGDYLLLPRIDGDVRVKKVTLKHNPVARHFKYRIEKIPLNASTAWMMGVYVAEGYSNRARICFSLHSKEMPVAEKIVSILGSLGTAATIRDVPNEDGIVIDCCSSVLGRNFREWFGHLAPNKKIPDFLMYHKDLEVVSAFLEGYALGDGNWASNNSKNGEKNQQQISTTSRLLASQVQLLYARLGRYASVYKKNDAKEMKIQGRTVHTKESYTIRFSPKNTNIRVFEREDHLFFMLPVRSVTRSHYAGEVYNIGTKSDNTYLVSNIITHNCSHAEENAIVQAAKNGIPTAGCTLYSTHSPCTFCSKMIINAGIKKVVASSAYPDQLGVRLMKEAGLQLVIL